MTAIRPLPALIVLLALAANPLPAADKKSEANLPPDRTLEELKSGNARFAAGKASHCWQPEDVRKALVAGQAPNAIVLSCSDSRVPPELVFDQGLGSLFTIRVAGNVATPETLASIEYAVTELGSRLIVVLGHESCGAVKAAITTPKDPKGKGAGSDNLNKLISEIQENLGDVSARPSRDDKMLRVPAMQNVASVARALMQRSAIVRAAVDSGKVKIVEGIYSLETEKVDFWK